MKRLLLILVLLPAYIFAQNSDNWQLKLGSNYAHGFITEQTQTIQLHFTGGFEKNNFEYRLDAFHMFQQQGERIRFSKNNQIFIGGYYYFLRKGILPYAGFQVGLAHAESTEYGIINENNELIFESAVSPLVSFGAGLDYKLNNRLDLNFECRQVYGKHMANSYPTYLDEFRISIGVGIYLLN